MISVLVEKMKPLDKYCPVAIGTAFSFKFVFDAKVQNSTFWNVSNLGLSCPKYKFEKRIGVLKYQNLQNM